MALASTWDTPSAVTVVLFALSAPAFSPPQLAVVYGYRSAVVRVATLGGWVMAPAGLLAALAVR